ncbi:MAG: aldo/keto reductase [Pseudomonadota bacterium]
MQLGLGTVQFGIDYGITNARGQTPPPEVGAILHELVHSNNHPCQTLDSAPLYGNAEAVLGAQLPRPHQLRIVSKTLPLDPEESLSFALASVRNGVQRSLEQLREQKLYALLVHRSEDLLGASGDALFALLAELRQVGWVDKIGVSVYSPADAQALLSRFTLDIVQLPLNILDQRMLQSGVLAELKARNIEVHARSVFLQGLLLDSNDFPNADQTKHKKPQALATVLKRFRHRLHELDLSPLLACLSFLKNLGLVDVALCGASGAKEWQEISQAFLRLPSLAPDVFQDLAQNDLDLIDPRRWTA